MVVKMDVFPYDIEISLADIDNASSREYSDRVGDALAWLDTMGMLIKHQWTITRLTGNDPAIISFRRQKDALLFKVAWG